MRRYMCTIEEVEENEKRTKRRRIDPTLSEVDVAGRSGLQQQWINQRQQHVAVEPRNIQNTRRGKNMRLDDTNEQVAEYLKKQIRRSNQILAQMEVDNQEKLEDYEESEDSEEDLEVTHFDFKDNEEEFFYSEIANNKRVESENNITLDGCGKPNSEMLEIMARRQQKLAQQKGQVQRTPSQSKFDKPELSSLAASIVGQISTKNHSEPMEVDFVPQGRRSIRPHWSKFDKPELGSLAAATVEQTSTQKHNEPMEVDIILKGRRSIREKLNSSVSQDSGKLTPAMQEILARKQQASKLGRNKKLDQTVSSTTELVSNISTGSQQIERGTRNIRNKSGAGNITTTEISEQIEDVAMKKGRSKSLQQPGTSVRVTGKELKTHNESINKDKCVTEDVGKLTPAMQEILARKQQRTASKQGQNKKLDQTVSSTTENIAVIKMEQLSPKVTLEYSKSIEMETKTTTTYSTGTAENTGKPTSAMQDVFVQKQQQVATKPRKSRNAAETTGKPTSAMQEVFVQKQQQVASKPRKSRKLDQTITSTVETSPTKLVPVQSHIEAEMKTRRKSTRQPQPNVSGAGDSFYHKPQEENKELQKEDQLDPVVSENTSKLTPAMKAILTQKQQKEAASKQGVNKKKSRAGKSILEVVDDSTEEKQQTLNEPVKKGRGKKANQTVSSTVQSSASGLSEPEDEGPKPRGKRTRKEVPDVSSTTKVEEPSVSVSSVTVSARGKRRTAAALLKESNENTEINLNNVPQVKKEQKIEKETAKRGKKSIARSEDLNTNQNVENPTPAMQQLLAKKQQRALEKSAKGKK